MATVVVTPPAARALSLEEVKRHVRADHSDEDAYIEALIDAAIALVENWTGRAFVTQTLELRRDDFEGDIFLRAPLASITSVKYDDAAGNEQTLSSGEYRVVNATRPRLVLVAGEIWPTLYDHEEAVRVRYVAGYGAGSSAVPAPLRHAMLLMVGNWYATRESIVVGQPVNEIPGAVDALIAPYRALII